MKDDWRPWDIILVAVGISTIVNQILVFWVYPLLHGT